MLIRLKWAWRETTQSIFAFHAPLPRLFVSCVWKIDGFGSCNQQWHSTENWISSVKRKEWKETKSESQKTCIRGKVFTESLCGEWMIAFVNMIVDEIYWNLRGSFSGVLIELHNDATCTAQHVMNEWQNQSSTGDKLSVHRIVLLASIGRWQNTICKNVRWMQFSDSIPATIDTIHRLFTAHCHVVSDRIIITFRLRVGKSEKWA